MYLTQIGDTIEKDVTAWKTHLFWHEFQVEIEAELEYPFVSGEMSNTYFKHLFFCTYSNK